MKSQGAPTAPPPPRAEETLDPDDWSATEALAHRAVADAVAHLRDLRQRPVWRDPAEVKRFFEAPLPHEGEPLDAIYRDVVERLMPYPMGNIHPRFWGWYMGAGSFTGALAEFLAAIQGSNLGGGNHAAAFVDDQVIAWLKAIVGFPAT